MPLPPLSEPKDIKRRISSVARGAMLSSALFESLVLVNTAQTLSLFLRPFSLTLFRRFNRRIAGMWLSLCVVGSELFHDFEVTETGDDVPEGENAIILCNHQQMPDIPIITYLAFRKGRVDDLRFFVKDALKYAPALGYGLNFIDTVFVKRNWTEDRESIEGVFRKIIDTDSPIWMTTFVEGTRLTKKKLEETQSYAREKGLYVPRHVLVPRRRGFVATVAGLRSHVNAIYDLTIAYEDGVPNLWQFAKGLSTHVHLNVRRWPIEDIPNDEDELYEWLKDRFVEKDNLLEHYYNTGGFAGFEAKPKRTRKRKK